MFREAIHEELDRRDWTIHRLVKEAEIGRATAYDYLNGEREIQTDSLERIFHVLNLGVKRELD
jgi:transcriptional regulator with XRE-family HTH domain